MGAKRIRTWSLVRVVREYPKGEDRIPGCSLVGALGVLIKQYAPTAHTYPYEVVVGVCSDPQIDLGYPDDVHEVEQITEEDYIREFTAARLLGRQAYSLEQLHDRAKIIREKGYYDETDEPPVFP